MQAEQRLHWTKEENNGHCRHVDNTESSYHHGWREEFEQHSSLLDIRKKLGLK